MSSCQRLKCYEMSRHLFITSNAVGSALDVGAADGSMWYMMNPRPNPLVLFDMDSWSYKFQAHSVQGDACRLPFNDGSFDTVVLGDILEHAYDPLKVLKDAYRVSRERLIITVPDQEMWDNPELPPTAGSMREFLEDRVAKGIQKPLPEQIEEWRIGHNKLMGHISQCLKVHDPNTLHLWHLRVVDLDDVENLLRGIGQSIYIVIVHIHEPITRTDGSQGFLYHFGMIIAKNIESAQKFGTVIA